LDPYQLFRTKDNSRLSYGADPELVAAYCSKIRLDESGMVAVLHWQPPDVIEIDPVTHHVTREKMEPTSAPVYLPLNGYLEKFRPRNPLED
jgi:hypothetical protein